MRPADFTAEISRKPVTIERRDLHREVFRLDVNKSNEITATVTTWKCARLDKVFSFQISTDLNGATEVDFRKIPESCIERMLRSASSLSRGKAGAWDWLNGPSTPIDAAFASVRNLSSPEIVRYRFHGSCGRERLKELVAMDWAAL